MVNQFQNLFPEDIREAAKVIYGPELMQPVLFKLQPGNPADSDLNQFKSPSTKLLSRSEIATLERYKLPKRRSEYLTGRICAKMAAESYLTHTGTSPAPVTVEEIEIHKDNNGRPFVHINHPGPRPVMDISISHSGDYGAALAAGSICGIDLQQQAETLLKVKDKFCTEIEDSLLKDILPDEKILTRLNLLWTAKEAAQKALSYWWMPGFLDLQATGLIKKFTNCIALSLILNRSKNQHMPQKTTVVTGTFSNYALAICLINKDRNSA